MKWFYLGSVSVITCMALLVLSGPSPYPMDGYELTGIPRLLRLQRIMLGEIAAARPVAGATKSMQDIKLNLLDAEPPVQALPEPDPGFTRAINSIFPNLDESYSIAVLDITPGRAVRYAERKGSARYQPGSVGKLAIAVGFFTELSKIYPTSFRRRQILLQTKTVRGGKWAMKDSHTVPFFEPETNRYYRRTVVEDDTFSLYVWADHMMSASNNGAASVMWREAVLMRVFGKEYPSLTEEMASEYFRSTPKSEMSDIAISVVNDPLRTLGIEEEEWRLGTFFTTGASSFIPNRGGSTGSARGLMKFLVLLESGKVVDKESSLEIKRLMYMTDRRIRYAASPQLNTAAVFFKSGSLYSCQPEEGFTCIQYQGNRANYMNSVAIIEHDDGTIYLVVLMSNILKTNSAGEHLALASRVDGIVRAN